ncbi:methyltransferase domain-containing protein [Limoniibacter endophyticus]|uniref:SAM-dependent methyltransferase n=1 Tax=Limoniibacter endophyticus TaxID=1565040 RepID=A0A8J3DTZ0_9HYPH|nr:methyltransferase domain-containing protein [Limoniibacter endophyticus]GHC76353.1 SAM-dependent methyltransferase [Limoniibacter endophyticus]
MTEDIVELRRFYDSSLGARASRSIHAALSSLWEPMSEERLMGLGYTMPWLDRFAPDAERVLAFMPARQGATTWPSAGPNAVALVYEEELPLADASLDRVLLVHALEHAENPEQLLMEIWRVLSPNGRVVVVVPNRRGVWARFEHTPFGTGRPFSRTQLSRLMRAANFTPSVSAEALFSPPSEKNWVAKLDNVLERGGRRFWPAFAGALIMEGQKRLYQGLAVKQRSSRRVFVPALEPQGVAGTAYNRDGQV